MISVRQCGQAKYGCGFSTRRFTAFMGSANDLPHDGFEHVKLCFKTAASFFLLIAHPSSRMMESRVYSCSAFTILSLIMEFDDTIILLTVS